MQKLTILGEFPDLNSIIDASKQHWAKYHVFKKQYTDYVTMIAKTHLQPVTKYPVSIQTTWYCPTRRKDPDNVAAGKKFILDGLVEAGILKGDAWKHISELHDSFFVDKENPRVEISLTA